MSCFLNSEFGTLREVLNKAINKYKVRKVRVMADRGLFSESNLSFFEGLKKRGLKGEYILSCPLRKLSRQHKEKILDRDNYSGGNLLEEKSYYEFRYKRRRVVVSSHQSKREKILDKLKV